MENYRMGRACSRPYNRTCGMNRPQPADREMNNQECSCRNKNSCNCVPLQYALNVGTIFPQLCKPFCGKRGVRR